MDYMDWIAWEIWNGNGKEYGFPDEDDEPEEEEDTDLGNLLEELDRILEPIRNLEWEDEDE